MDTHEMRNAALTLSHEITLIRGFFDMLGRGVARFKNFVAGLLGFADAKPTATPDIYEDIYYPEAASPRS